jgi:hypothetical protein
LPTFLRIFHFEYSQMIEDALKTGFRVGNESTTSAFPRLTEPNKYEEKGERELILLLVPLIYNFRLEVVGLNQIQNTYVPQWSKDNVVG